MAPLKRTDYTWRQCPFGRLGQDTLEQGVAIGAGHVLHLRGDCEAWHVVREPEPMDRKLPQGGQGLRGQALPEELLNKGLERLRVCLLYTSPSPRD